MEITILQQDEKPLLKRKEVRARVFFEKETPSRQRIADALASKLGCKRELLIVGSIKTAFGDTAATVEARCYTDADTLARIERENLRQKNAKVAEPEPEPAAEEAPVEEAPAEDAPAEEAEE